MVNKENFKKNSADSSGSESPVVSDDEVSSDMSITDDEDSEFCDTDSESESADAMGEYESEANLEEDIALQLEKTITFNMKTNFFKVNNTPTCLRFSPTHNLLGVSTVNGDLELFTYVGKNFTKITVIECYADNSCLGFDYSVDGNIIYGISPNNGFTLIDSHSEQIINFCEIDKRDHLTAVKTVNDSVICTGDDRGNVKYWDIRNLRPFGEYRCFKSSKDRTNDYISGIIVHDNDNLIATSSGAGIVTVSDKRTLKILHQSAEAKADLTSLTSVGKKNIVSSCLNGSFLFTNWYKGEESSQIFQALHNASCNELCTIDNVTIISAWEDCLVRIHSMFPHKLLGVLGKQVLPPEHLATTPDSTIAVSDSFDKRIYLWDISKMNERISNYRRKIKDNLIIERSNFFQNLE